MSIFNALTTATAGINAQSTAFTNLSNNIANSQTVGYKASETSFQDFVSNSLASTSTQAVSDGVGAVTTSQTQQQGTISSSTNSLAVAISGNGFFDVALPSGEATAGTETFSDQQYYTRNGDFSEDKNGYLVNTSGYYLEGYMADAKTGTLDTSQLTEINASNIAFRPTETTTLTMTGGISDGSTTATAMSDASTAAYNAAIAANETTAEAQTAGSNAATAAVTSAVTAATAAGTTVPGVYSQTIYDSTSAAHTVSTVWSEDTDAETAAKATDSDYSDTIYNVTVTNGDSSDTSMQLATNSGTTPATTTYQVTFDSSGNIVSVQQPEVDSSGNAVTDSNGNTVYTNVGTGYTGSTAELPVTLTYTNGAAAQTVNIDLGTIGSAAGTTTAAENSTTPTLTSDSATSATYEGLEMQSDGSIMAEFSNGDTQLVGKIALSSFNNADGLMAVDGQAYVATSASGSAKTGVVGTNGTGTLETSSTESSTTDLTSDLSSLIVTQEAYTANTKIVTTADTLLQATISMIR